VLRPDGSGRRVHVDARGRLYVPTWLRRLVGERGPVVASARWPGLQAVVVAPAGALDTLADAVVAGVG
jgi:hypothetical protein